MIRHWSFRQARWCLALIVFLAASGLDAAEPAIRNLDIRGLRVGGTTTLVIDGDDLGTAPRLLLPFPAKQTLQPKSTDKRASFEIILGDVEPGYHHLRVVSESGVSLPVVIGVDRLPQQLLTPSSDLPAALHGSVSGGTTVESKFQGKAKQKVMIEVEAHRLGSKLRPVVHLISPKKLQIGWSWPSPSLFGDTRLEAVLPEDGVYVISLHDMEYAAPAPSFFRLKIGEWSAVDQVFPSFVSADSAAKVQLLGPGEPVGVDVKTSKGIAFLPIAWPKAGLWSGPRPFVTVTSRPELVNQPATDKFSLPQGPVAVSGRLIVPYAEDRYQLAVAPGKKVKLEVFAERIGSPLDAALVVRNDKGDQLARAEDSPGTLDPTLEYAVPDKVTSILVGVVDAQGRGGPRSTYHLVIDPQPPSPAQEGFRLFTPVQRISLPIGGRIVVPVQVDRKSAGKIDLAAALPAGLKLEGAVIPEGADGTLLTLGRAEAAFEPVITTWRGRGTGDEATVVLKGHPLERLQPWLATEIALAPTTAKASEFVIDWRGLAPEAALVPGSKLALPVKIERTDPKTSVKLTLMTSQITPVVNNQPDPNKALRQEKPVEMPVKVADGEVIALVPAELSAPVYDVTVQAELLAPDKKVLATTFAPVRRMQVRLPLALKLEGPARIETPFDPKKGATVKIQGKLERKDGLKADVALALAGLPAGAKADAVTLKGDATDFALNVFFPPNIAPGEFSALKLSASFAPDAKQPNIRVRSRDVEVTLVLQAPKK
jgi:hypothetical protein